MKKFKCYCGQLLKRPGTNNSFYQCLSPECFAEFYLIKSSKIEVVSINYCRARTSTNKLYCTKKWYLNNLNKHKYVIRVVEDFDMNEFSKFMDNITLLE